MVTENMPSRTVDTFPPSPSSLRCWLSFHLVAVGVTNPGREGSWGTWVRATWGWSRGGAGGRVGPRSFSGEASHLSVLSETSILGQVAQSSGCPGAAGIPKTAGNSSTQLLAVSSDVRRSLCQMKLLGSPSCSVFRGASVRAVWSVSAVDSGFARLVTVLS